MARFITGKAAWPAALVAAATLLLSAPASAEPDPTAPDPAEPGSAAPDAPVLAQAAAHEPAAETAAPHLSSLENPPPGTTAIPDQDTHGLTYLRELWHAYQTQEVSGRGALLMLTQRPMDPAAAPPPGVPGGPQAPTALPPESPAPPETPAVPETPAPTP